VSPGGSIQNEVSGARMVSDLGGELLFDARTAKAYVVDRSLLDREMAQRAADAGAEYLLKTSVSGMQGSSLLTRGVRGREEISFRLVIAADGPRSSVARMLGLRARRSTSAGCRLRCRAGWTRATWSCTPTPRPTSSGG